MDVCAGCVETGLEVASASATLVDVLVTSSLTVLVEKVVEVTVVAELTRCVVVARISDVVVVTRTSVTVLAGRSLQGIVSKAQRADRNLLTHYTVSVT